MKEFINTAFKQPGMKWVMSLVLWIFVCGQTSSDPGTRFLVTFPQSMTHKAKESFLRVMPVGTDLTVVTLVTLPSAPSPINTSLHLLPLVTSTYAINDVSEMLPTGTLISDMTIEVEASNPVVIEVVNTVKSNGDMFAPIPVDDLGTEYFVAAGTNMSSISASFVTVSAPYDDTEVTMTFPPEYRRPEFSASLSERFTLQGVTYFPNDVIKFTLNRLQTMQLQSPLDLTGMRVNSSKPVAVLSGQNRSNIYGNGCLSHLLEQMPPVSHWATSFVLVHLPGQPLGDYYRFVAKESYTVLALAGGSEILKIQDAGGFVDYLLPDGEFVYVQASLPVLVLQYTREQGGGFRGDPAMLALTALSQAQDVYYVMTTRTNMDAYAVITIRSQDTLLLMVNNQLLMTFQNVTWHNVSGSADYVVGHVKLETGDFPCILGKVGGPEFIAYMYYATNCECWAMALTHGSPVLQTSAPSQVSSCPTATNHPGDGLDNDCDTSIDEEPCYINWEPLDMDGDQYKNEDCARQDEAKCRTQSGDVYPCTEIQKSTTFTEDPDTRRQADTITVVQDALSKFKCGVTCTLTPGCWGMNFDPDGREGHHCELLMGLGRGLFPAQGVGFQSMKSVSSYSSP